MHIEKRRTSGYHAQGNGFAERSIRNIRGNILRTSLLDRELPQQEWRKILDSVIFALNSSISKSINCTPFEVVFGRRPTLPMDNYLNTKQTIVTAGSPDQYISDLKIQLLETISHVSKFLGISRDKMAKQYNKKLKIHKYGLNDEVWLRKKTFGKHENKKLSARRTGPWKIVKLYTNGVNFKIEDRNKKS